MNDQSPAQIGHNQPTLYQSLSERLQALKLTAERWLTERPDPLKWDQEIADKAAGFETQLRDLWNDAEKARKAEKDPILEEGKRIDAMWGEIKTVAETAGKMMKAKKEVWLKEQDRIIAERRAEEQRKAQAAQQAAREAQARAEEEALKAAEGEGQGLSPVEAQLEADRLAASAREQEKAANAAARAKPAAGGQYVGASGRARSSGLRTTYDYEIEDAEAAAKHFAHHPKMAELLKQLARGAHTADRSVTIPGIKITEERKA